MRRAYARLGLAGKPASMTLAATAAVGAILGTAVIRAIRAMDEHYLIGARGLPVTQSITGKAVETKSSVVIDDRTRKPLASTKRQGRSDLADSRGLRCLNVMLMGSKNRPVGAPALLSVEVDAFTVQAARAMDNSLQYTRTVHLLRLLHLIRRANFRKNACTAIRWPWLAFTTLSVPARNARFSPMLMRSFDLGLSLPTIPVNGG